MKRKPEEVTKEEILAEYINKPHSELRETASRLGCSIRGFRKALTLHGFKANGEGKIRTAVSKMRDFEWLKMELTKKPLNQIAREIGTTSGNISDFCKRHNLKPLITKAGGKVRRSNGTTIKWWKKKLLKEVGKCEFCGWNEHKEILDLHHMNLNTEENTRENLRLLCPNCHVWIHYQQRTGRYARGQALKGMVGKNHPRFGNKTSYEIRMKQLKAMNTEEK